MWEIVLPAATSQQQDDDRDWASRRISPIVQVRDSQYVNSQYACEKLQQAASETQVQPLFTVVRTASA